MNKTEINDLIKLVAEVGISELSITEKDGFSISIKKNMVQEVLVPAVSHANYLPTPMNTSAAAVSAPIAESSAAHYKTIKSPMIGTLYLKPSPDKPAFVNVGDEFTTGKVVCLIEAMKLFNEVEADFAGKIVKVLVSDNSPVEFDQPLFLVDPS